MTSRLIQTLTILFVLTLPSLAFAAGGGDGHGFPWAHFAASLVNLGIFLAILWKFALPPMRKYFAERREQLAFNLNEAKRLRQEAELKLREVEEQAASLGAEREALMAKYTEQGESERDRIVEDAKVEVEKLRKNAERLIEQETKKAIASIERQAVDKAIEIAKSSAAQKVAQGDTQKVLVEQYIQDLKRIETQGI